MFPNLFAELARRGWSLKKLAEEAKIPYPSLLNKTNGKTEFTRAEMCSIKKIVAPQLTMDFIFEDNEKDTA